MVSDTKFQQSLDGLNDDPLRRAWRGNKQGTIELASVPRFDNPYDEREWIKGHMAAAFRYWGKLGFGEGVSVHFSVITKSHLVLVGPDGYVSPHGAQLPINTSGFHIHSAIHKARPDVKAAAHCHSINGKAWSVFGKPIDILTQDACFFHDNLAVYANFGGVVLAQEEGENIAQALGPKKNTCILQNHGLMTLGQTVDEAVYLFAALDRMCKVQLMVEAAAANGLKKSVIDPEDAEFSAKTLQHWENMYVNFQTEYELLLQETNGAFLK
ncbi:class II aldolase/adducin N-terminal [Schizophyllum amplum]|uniref:Class II aldolase/adducin N-terminal n=1 Tax=Schizophyllum amplum TaxID=97359 RepID=A0A550CNS3_9AGAR|nr:class II aldolase/adducin N-terminal [Auriculariopsis ampla]